MPDPKLKAAAAEIQAVLLKYDIAALVTLASQAHMEFLFHVNPSWSCASVEGPFVGGSILRIRANRADFPDLESHHKVVTDTVGMMLGFLDVEKKHVDQLEKILFVIAKDLPDIQHVSQRDG